VNKRITLTLAAGALAVGIAAGFAGALSLAVHADPYGDTPRCTDLIADQGGICHGEPLPPCPTEDSSDCYWDAATMGNGQGRSFIDEHGTLTYTD
jgi:hypothetical protein